MRDDELEALAEWYRGMSEEQLMEAARAYDGMAEPAQALVRAEFTWRGLESPLAEDVEAEELPIEPVNLVTVGLYRDLAEGIVARNALEVAGLECVLRDENLVRMDWLLSNLIGNMRLQVKAEDEAAALDALEESTPQTIAMEGQEEFRQPVCPKCRASEVVLNDPDRKFAAASMLLGWFTGLLIPHWKASREAWRCLVCGCRWTDDGESPPGAENAGPLR